MTKATLILDDGSRFEGLSFGYETPVAGEVVFNTAMMGYPESLTDPSYAGQIMVLTYPLVGNYGVPPFTYDDNGLPLYMESDRIHASAIIVGDYSGDYSHWNGRESLGEWLKREHVPGITGIDTRELTKVIREHGVMTGRIVIGDSDEASAKFDYAGINHVANVSCKEVITYQPTGTPIGKKVVLVDCGVKANIIRCLTRRGVEVIRVPWDYDFTDMDFDGLFLANGPGDPETCSATVENIRKFIDKELSAEAEGRTVRPIMGICMGNQLLSKAAGATIYKLKYGHRSHNQPVRMEGTERCYITSQNHGYAVDIASLGDDWEVLFTNMNDGSNEGIRHKRLPWFSAQFHPEAASGPVDTEFLFDAFITALKDERHRPLTEILDTDKPEHTSDDLQPKAVKKVLLLGSGALKIGEAGEFDYSGSQALKAMREEGIETVLINPNIATVQTSEGSADRIYFLPVTPFFVEKVIKKERPDGIMLAFGGQTALNCGIELHKSGVLKKYGVKVLGTP
ncbi:MAG: glutamine-hydrolyzing carbamoyl-phosphate synthase small subunit, partial [Muribaculaceae bacterium]|nr:glutamine-hydrolyzing carbamoyl-phosphate synthase small subunit [Muribaculaceae bacterium]